MTAQHGRSSGGRRRNIRGVSKQEDSTLSRRGVVLHLGSETLRARKWGLWFFHLIFKVFSLTAQTCAGFKLIRNIPIEAENIHIARQCPFSKTDRIHDGIKIQE